MSKQWKPNKKTVELEQPAKPSRIRRDPVRKEELAPAKLQWWHSSEGETKLALIGIVGFALAINAILFGLGQITSH